MTTQKIEIDIFKYLYYKRKGKLIDEEELLKPDFNLTTEFQEYIQTKIKHKELINIALRGEVRTGKSTVGIKIMKDINNELHKQKHNNTKIELIKHIFSDQTEFIRFISTDERNVAVMIDEFNKMAETGLNATTESALFDYYSDVFAAKYVHRVSCSPSIILDKNATVILDIIGKNEKQKTTRCKLTYRCIEEQVAVTLGWIDINVGQILKEPFYIKYITKKMNRMKLLDTHGIRDIRELEFSGIVIETIKELSELALINKLQNEIITATVDAKCREFKRIYSLITKADIGTRCRATLGLMTELQRYKNMEKKAKTDKTREIIIKGKEKIKEMLDKRIAEEQRLQNIYKEFLNIQ